MKSKLYPLSGKGLLILTLTTVSTVPAIADVEIYGRAHVSVDSLSDGNDSGWNVSSNSSRLGFRADMEVAPGVTGIMQLEQEIRYENGSGEFSTRDSYVGLRGRYGQIRLGYFDTPLKIISGKVDFFRDQIGETRNVTRVRDGYSGADFDFDTRFRNGIHYRSPEFNNVTFDLHYSTNTDTGSNIDGDNDAVSTALSYETDNSYLAVAYERKNATGSDALRLGAGQSFGALRVNLLAQAATVEGSTLGDKQDVNTYGGGLSYQLSEQIVLKGQYYRIAADGQDRDADMLTVGMDYFLSPDFRLLFAYARTDNEDNAAYAMSKGGHGEQITPLPGETPDGLSAGFRFDF